MTVKPGRSPRQPHKKSATRHDPAIKHEKECGKRSTTRDMREDRGGHKKKLANPK